MNNILEFIENIIEQNNNCFARPGQKLKNHLYNVKDIIEDKFKHLMIPPTLALLHDYGKLQRGFQDMLFGKTEISTPHSPLGAYLAYKIGDGISCFIIMSHHGLLKNKNELQNVINKYEKSYKDSPFLLIKEKVNQNEIWPLLYKKTKKDLYIRMVFGALVYADRIDAMRHNNGFTLQNEK